MDNELPEFQTRTIPQVMPYARNVFSTSLIKLMPQEDGHFRVIFRKDYFTIQEGQTEPTKSQWSTLKKRMKRRNKRVFIFKEHGDAPDNDECYYLDFGFFAYT